MYLCMFMYVHMYVCMYLCKYQSYETKGGSDAMYGHARFGVAGLGLIQVLTR